MPGYGMPSLGAAAPQTFSLARLYIALVEMVTKRGRGRKELEMGSVSYRP